MKKFLLVVGASLLMFGACGTGGVTKVDTQFPTTVSNSEKAMKGGNLKYGIVTSSALPGIYSPVYYTSAQDSAVLDFVQPSMFRHTPEMELDTENPGLASIAFADDMLSLTVTINPDLKWHDGVSVTSDDYIFAFEVLGHKDYSGIRYTGAIPEIVGMDAYHNGDADTIVGLEKIDNNTVKVNFVAPNVSVKSNFWGAPMPKHVFKDISMKDMPSSEYVRKNVIGYGAFKVDKIIPGESLKLVRFDEYPLEKAKVDSVEITAIQPTSIEEVVKAGNVDIIYQDSYPTDKYDPSTVPDNVEVVGKLTNRYSYFGFKLGYWDKAKTENVPVPTMKMSNVKLRQAMMYAVNNEAVGENFYKGLRIRANTIVPPTFKKFHDATIEGYVYNPEKAKQLLDEAGYKDVDGDGFRETPEGEKLVINYAALESSDVSEPQANFYIQNWNEIGLDVQLLDGRLHEFNSFYDRVAEDDKAIDVFEASWNTGYDQNPDNLWGPKAYSNDTRFQSSEGNAIIDAINSEKAALDEAYRIEQFSEWQKYFIEDVPAAPALYSYTVAPVNKRVKNYTIAQGASPLDFTEIELTAEEPIKA